MSSTFGFTSIWYSGADPRENWKYVESVERDLIEQARKKLVEMGIQETDPPCASIKWWRDVDGLWRDRIAFRVEES